QWSFYGLRICLGIAEAGFFPGIILYLSYWFPERQRAKMTAFFMMAIGLAFVLGNPLSGFIMQYLDSYAGLHGWQWLFLLEGIPSVILGVAVFYYLTDYPRDASWLSSEQKDWIVSEMEKEEQQRKQRFNADRLSAVLQWRVWLLIAIYSTLAVGTNASGAYFPKLIKQQFDYLDTFQIGLLSALPHICAIVGMIVFSISSDRMNERRGHLIVAALLAVIGWSLAAANFSPVIALVGLCIAQTGMMSMIGVKVDKDTQDKAKLAAAVADLLLEMTKESPLTPVEERILGYECLAHCIGKDTVLPPTNPISIYVNWMGTKIAANSSMPYPSIGYTFVVVQDDNTINAMAMPGGPIIITTGMLKFLESESELATILGHEIAHVEERHGMKAAENAGAKKLVKLLDFAQMQASGKLDKFLNDALASAAKDVPEAIRKEAVKQLTKQGNDALEALYAKLILAISESISKGSSQAGECAADLRGMSLARAAGWNPVALQPVLARLKATKGIYGGALSYELRADQAKEVVIFLPPLGAESTEVLTRWKKLESFLSN
ncbi:MAG: putative tartrate transporter, partial [Planctomycetota bacterium]